MKYNLVQEAKVEGLGHVGHVEAPFDQSLEAFKDNNYEAPISGRDLAFARIKEGAKSSLSQNGSYIREGMLGDLQQPERVLFLSVSSIIEYAKKATQAHRESREYNPGDKIVEEYRNQAEEDLKKGPQERRVFILSKNESYAIPTNRFGEHEETLWLFKDQAVPYGDFLRENGINEMPVWLLGAKYTKDQKKPFERQLWLHLLGDRSELVGGGRVLGYDYRVRGVSRGAVTAEGGSQKMRSYTIQDIREVLHAKGLPGLEEILIPAFEQKE